MDFGPNQIEMINKVLVRWVVTYGDSWQPMALLGSMVDKETLSSPCLLYSFELVREGLFDRRFDHNTWRWVQISEKGKQWLLTTKS